MTDLRISLSPTGGLRLHIGNARDRTLDIPLTQVRPSTDETFLSMTLLQALDQGDIETARRAHLSIMEEREQDIKTVRRATSAMRIIKRILQDVQDNKRDQPGYIGQFPTQEVLDAWLRQDAQRKREDEAEKWAAKGIDVKELEFKL